ncbi:MAG: hypothetical protein IKD80_04690, partial [Selenomonadaceae bacterium]|nr:hypothetical protein [Selenomonadaceae bacterium]
MGKQKKVDATNSIEVQTFGRRNARRHKPPPKESRFYKLNRSSTLDTAQRPPSPRRRQKVDATNSIEVQTFGRRNARRHKPPPKESRFYKLNRSS